MRLNVSFNTPLVFGIVYIVLEMDIEQILSDAWDMFRRMQHDPGVPEKIL